MSNHKKCAAEGCHRYIDDAKRFDARYCSGRCALREVARESLAYRKRNEIIYRYESMAILVQQVEGKRVGRYFLPDLAGVIFSENPYCWSRRMSSE